MSAARENTMASRLKDEDRRRTRRNLVTGAVVVIAAASAVALVAALMPARHAPANEAGPYAQKSEQLTAEGWDFFQGQEAEQSLESAIEKFDEAARLDPKNANAWNGLGWAHLNSGDIEAAGAAFAKVLALQPTFPAALNGLGQIALYQRNYDEAEKYLLEAAPQAQAAWFGLAKLYLLTGKYDQAELWAQKLLATGEPNPTAEEVLRAAKSKSLSAELRDQLAPSPTTAELGRAWRLVTHGRQTEAQAIYNTVLAKNPKDANALNGMGWSLLNDGDGNAAKPYFERALTIEPHAVGSLNGLARVSYAKGDVAGAIKIWQEMVENIPGFHAGTASLADAYLEQGEYDKAIPLLEKWAAAEPPNIQVQEKLQRAREKAKTAAKKNGS
jgi:tetratricopeptide (TPR) repeat protein